MRNDWRQLARRARRRFGRTGRARRRDERAAIQRILASGLFDLDFYTRQTATDFDDVRSAVEHYVRRGDNVSFAPHPLFSPPWYRSANKDKAGVALDRFLTRGQAGQASPHFDGAAWLAAHPEAAAHRGGALGHWLAQAGPDTLTVSAGAVEPVTLAHARAVAERAADLHRTPEPVVPVAPVPRRISVVLSVRSDWGNTRATINRWLRADDDLEVVVVDRGPARRVLPILSAIYAGTDRVRVTRAHGEPGVAESLHHGTRFASGEFLLLSEVGADPRKPKSPWLRDATALLVDDVVGVGPVVLDKGERVLSAGWVGAGADRAPIPLWAGHPTLDLPDVETLEVAAPATGAFLLRRTTYDAAGGLQGTDDFAELDLALRIAERTGGRFLTLTRGRVWHRLAGRREAPSTEPLLATWGGRLPAVDPAAWTTTGLGVESFGDDGTPVVRRPARVVTSGPAAGLPSLRWALKNAAGGGPPGDRWGDTAFIDDLARALERLGQEVIVDRREAHVRPVSDHLDDVTLNLRGLIEYTPQPGPTNLLWVISHPDEVTPEEVSAFDLAWSAGHPWAEEMTRRSGRPVRTMLQATDTSRFHAEGPALSGLGTLFVGRTRGVFRPIIRDAIAADADLTIFGDGWEEYIDPSYVLADHLPNKEVPAAYRGARIVLNDHWEDMARLGFYSNRLFDAVSCGARVVSDASPELEDVFGPSVHVYTSVDDLAELTAPDSTRWADDATIAANAARVASEHSFDHRALELLAAVLDHRGVPHHLL